MFKFAFKKKFMLSVSNLSVQFGKRVLFDEVNVSFTKGNCYGIIGANGAGKSTFLKILSGALEPNSGSISLETGKRMSVFEQNHNAFDSYPVLETVLRGNQPLFNLKSETAMCPLRTLVKISFILLFEFFREIVRVTSVVPNSY